MKIPTEEKTVDATADLIERVSKMAHSRQSESRSRSRGEYTDNNSSQAHTSFRMSKNAETKIKLLKGFKKA